MAETNVQAALSASLLDLQVPYSGKFWLGKYWQIGFIQKLTGEILTESLLDNLYLLYNYTELKILKGKILTDR